MQVRRVLLHTIILCTTEGSHLLYKHTVINRHTYMFIFCLYVYKHIYIYVYIYINIYINLHVYIHVILDQWKFL